MANVGSISQNGILLPGGIKPDEFLSNLASLSSSQQEMVNRAKKYALDQSVKSLLQKQILTSQQQQQRSLQRHKALALMCRVYVGSISFELREENIKTAFSVYGAVKTISMSWDSITQKHKGYAFVEFELPEAAQLALDHMNGIQLGGRQIKVGWPSNMPQAAPIIEQIRAECEARNRIYISNVHPELSEQELSNIFDPFGKVRECKLAMTPDVEKPQHRGYGFIEFEKHIASTEALTMDNFDLGGQMIHVCRAITPDENLSANGTLDSEKAQASVVASVARPTRNGDELNTRDQLNCSAEQLTSDSKIVTNGSDGSESISCVLVLRNMVTAQDELDDGLQLDVYEECSKYGSVLQVIIYIERKEKTLHESNSKEESLSSNRLEQDEVKIFVKYKDQPSGRQAREALNGRFFGGRKISAEHYDRDKFRQNDYST